ncbi:unnamed protein product [Larinioides sclopetarius]|uniref:DNA mismatch repair proteins mutS family domain-containing protein n=1 Tax=Larinioides sclopetarius TaxID=280406 RepID=A0AAV2ANL0_9ARAC
MSDLSATYKSPAPHISGEEEFVQNDSFVQPKAFTNSSTEHPKPCTSSSCNSVHRTSSRSSSSTSHSYSGGDRSSTSKSSTTPQSCANTKLVAIVEGRGIARGEIGMACIDIKNPVLLLSQFADTQAYLRLAIQLNVLKPLEVVMPNTSLEYGSKTKLICRIKELFPEMTTVTVQRKYFNETKGLQYIQELCASEYKTVEIEVSPKYYCLAACAALLKYFEFKQNATYATNSLKIVYCTIADTTMISMSTARNLELVTNELGKAEHCLYGVLNHTLTPGGDRLLRANILQPPCDLNTINTRLDCISELIEKEELFYDLKSVIGKFVDTENLLSLCVQIPKEENVRSCEQKIANVICMKHTLELVKPLCNCLATCTNALFQTYFQVLSDGRFLQLQEKISLVIHTDARWQKGVLNMHMQKCFAVKPNINGLLDVARRAYSESVNDVSAGGAKNNMNYRIAIVEQNKPNVQLPGPGRPSSGKSTYMKQLAVLQIMAQMGSYVPAEFASFRIADQILTRMGSSSDIEKNYSTFMLQMKEANFVLQHATEKSLIIIDELGKGTSVEEGCSIAYAICEELLKTKAFIICSTHFTQLTQLSSAYPNVENYHFNVKYVMGEAEGCSCNFTHILTPGPCKEKYYGIKIAEISTMPQSIVTEAKNLVARWSEKQTPESEEVLSCDDGNKEKIKLVIHLIQLAQQDSLDPDGLKNHLLDLQAQFKIT